MNPYFRIKSALSTPFLGSAKEMKSFKEAMQNAENGTAADKTAAFGIIENYWSILQKAISGYDFPKSLEEKAGMLAKFSPGNAPVMPQLIDSFTFQTDELAVDLEWMRVYSFTTANATSIAQTLDKNNSGIQWAAIGDGVDIPLSPIGGSSITEVRRLRFAAAVGFLRLWLEQNEFWNANDVMSAMMVENLKFKADRAWTAIAAARTSGNVTTSAGSTLDNRITAMNTGTLALKTRLAGKGFGITSMSPILVLANEVQRPTVNQIIRRSTGAETNNIIIERPFIPVFTFNANFPSTYNPGGGAKSGVLLCQPGLKNKWVDFGAMRTNQEYRFTNDAIKMEAQQYFNNKENTDQFQWVNFEA